MKIPSRFLTLALLLTTVPLFSQQPPKPPQQTAKAIPPPNVSQPKPPEPTMVPETVKDKLLIAYHKALEAQMNAQIVQTQAQTAQQASQTVTQAYYDLEKQEAKAMGLNLPEGTHFTIDISKDMVSAPPQAQAQGLPPQPQNQVKN